MGRRLLNNLKTEIDKIKENDTREIIKKILLECSDYNCDGGASSSGKYHPEFSLGQGGLIRHTKAVCAAVETLVKMNPMYDNPRNWDVLYCAAILHDMKKYTEIDQGYSHNNHPILMANLIREYNKFFQCEYLERIAQCVETHMSRWHTNPKNENEKWGVPPSNMEHMIVAMADMLVAQKFIRIDFDGNEIIYG